MIYEVNHFTVMNMVQVQLRMPDEAVKKIDKMVDQGVFKTRSDAIKSMIEYYQEREKTMNFLKMIVERSKEAGEKPEVLIPIDDV